MSDKNGKLKCISILPIVICMVMSPNLLAEPSADASTNPTANASALKSSPSTPNSLGNNSQKQQNQQMTAIDIILQDHAKIKQMISQINGTLDSNIAQSRKAFEQLSNFLVNHETMEQQVWYPSLAQFKDLKNIIADLKKEEGEASKQLKQLNSIKDDKQWAAQFKKLSEAVAKHAHDEETLLFPKVKNELTENLLKEIGAELQDYKNKHP